MQTVKNTCIRWLTHTDSSVGIRDTFYIFQMIQELFEESVWTFSSHTLEKSRWRNLQCDVHWMFYCIYGYWMQIKNCIWFIKTKYPICVVTFIEGWAPEGHKCLCITLALTAFWSWSLVKYLNSANCSVNNPFVKIFQSTSDQWPLLVLTTFLII